MLVAVERPLFYWPESVHNSSFNSRFNWYRHVPIIVQVPNSNSFSWLARSRTHTLQNVNIQHIYHLWTQFVCLIGLIWEWLVYLIRQIIFPRAQDWQLSHLFLSASLPQTNQYFDYPMLWTATTRSSNWLYDPGPTIPWFNKIWNLHVKKCNMLIMWCKISYWHKSHVTTNKLQHYFLYWNVNMFYGLSDMYSRAQNFQVFARWLAYL